jgi:hypothetical protein
LKWFLGFLYALGLSTILVFWRCCYRVAELNQGFLGPVTFKQNLFVGFEGILMVLAVALLAIFHPALCMGDAMNGINKNTLTNALTEDRELNRSNGKIEKESRATEQIDSSAHDRALGESNT